jgi:PAS domain S-box-containing protein
LKDKIRSVLKSQKARLIREFSAQGLRRKRYDLLLCPGDIGGVQQCFVLLLTPGSENDRDLDWALKEVLEDIDGPAAFLDTEVRFREFNQLYSTTFETSAEDLYGKAISERNPSRQAKILETQVRHLIAHHQVRDSSADSLTTANRGILVASVKAWPVISADGSPLGLFFIIRPAMSSIPLPMADGNALELFGKSAILYGPPMFFTHVDGRIIAMNASARGTLKTEEGDGPNLKTSIAWETPVMIENLYHDILAGSEYSSFLSDISGPRGTRVVKVRAYAIKEIGDITSVVLIHLMDVTQDESTRNQLTENVRKYATEKTILGKLMEGLSAVRVGYAVVDRDLTMLRVSDSVLEAFDRGPTFFEGRKIYDVKPAVRDSGVLAYIKTTIDRRQFMKLDRFSFTLPGDEKIVANLGFHPMEFDGKTACLITAESVSEQQEVGDQEGLDARRFAALLESSEDLVMVTDSEGHIVDLNHVVTENTKASREDLIGVHIDDFVRMGVEEADLLLEFIHRAMETRKVVRTGMLTVTSKISGRPVFVEASYTPILGPDGSLEELVIVATYRTEVVELSQQVAEQTQNLRQMVNERTRELTESNVLLENTVGRLAAMARSGLVLSSLKDAESVIASFLKEVREVLGAEFASVALISVADDTSKTTYYSSGTAPPSGVIPADIVERSLAKLAVGNGSGREIEAGNPNVLIEEFAFAGFKGLMLVWREKDEFTALDGNLIKLLCTQLSFSLPITSYVTDLRLERDRSQALRRIAFRTAAATSVGSAVGIVAEELAKVLHADRFFWMVSGNRSDLWLSEVYRGSGLPVRQTRHIRAEQSECLEPLVDACNESHRLFCERFPGVGGDEFVDHRRLGGETPCPFLRRDEGTELAKCLKSLIKQTGMLGRESGALAIAPVTLSSSSWGMLCAYSDVGGSFKPDDTCFMCLAASTVRHMWQAADAAGSVRRLQADGETVSELAHDLKYPLMRISDSLDNLASGKVESADGESTMDALRAEVQRLDVLARELIDTSNLKKNSPEIVDLNDVLEDCMKLTADDAEGKTINIRKRLVVTPPPVFANQQDVKSILINVLINAIDAAGEGGWVDITVETDGDRGGAESVVLSIQDSGPGVPATELGRVFDPFYSTKESGSGIGLFSSKKRARANGGDLICEMGPDRKSRFVVWFPVASG